jgi:hypothetical protein
MPSCSARCTFDPAPAGGSILSPTVIAPVRRRSGAPSAGTGCYATPRTRGRPRTLLSSWSKTCRRVLTRQRSTKEALRFGHSFGRVRILPMNDFGPETVSSLRSLEQEPGLVSSCAQKKAQGAATTHLFSRFGVVQRECMLFAVPASMHQKQFSRQGFHLIKFFRNYEFCILLKFTFKPAFSTSMAS